MLDINFIRENSDLVKAAVKNKNLSNTVDIDKLLALDDKRKTLLVNLENLRRRRNEINDKVKKSQSDSEREQLIKEGVQLKPEIKELEEDLKGILEEYESILLAVPNVTSPQMPVGPNDSANVVLRKWGKVPEFDFEVKDHVELGKDLDIIDVEKSGDISGSRFYYLKNEAVLMQFAIVQLVMESLTDSKLVGKLAKKVGNPFDTPFSPVIPPVMMKPEIMKKMDRLDPIDERYEMKLDDLILVGSAEHTLGPLHMNEVFEKNQLPVRYIGYSTAFRREAGSHGKDVRGILRSHQFDKLEMETYTYVEHGESEQELILALQEHLVQQLEIPYQVVQICTGDTGKPDYNQYDIECWMPGHEKYRETHTSDYMTDYQARRLNIRYQDKEGNREYVHMNDATAFAIGRILIAIIENNQQKDGSVKVPTVLQKYVGRKVIKSKRDS